MDRQAIPILSGLLIISIIINLVTGFLYTISILILVLLLIAIFDKFQTRHSLLRNFPLVARFRWIIESLRPFVQQYVLEPDTGGAPIERMFRNIVYQRAKSVRETIPFGTQLDTYRTGYEWVGHSISARDLHTIDESPRVTIGGPNCKQPYSASVLNISAMSYGSLSKNAILALNRGAKEGNFFHNTGEGGLSPHHLKYGGDIVWQIGTGYFGCRNSQGQFDPDTFKKNALQPSVKMIEIKLSQGAKPGHGGILPANKNTPEIAEIRGVQAYTQVNSPPCHSAFKTPIEMMHFIKDLRELAEGKPIGFKLAIGRRSEFTAICKAMVETGVKPDFITVDGGEGGTGAAPLEYSNSIGTPLREAVAYVDDMLRGFDLRGDIKVIASGKIITGFHLVKHLALGADLCNSARGMMLALGCVQSLSCNSNKCPTGVATQDETLESGLVVEEKYKRVHTFHAKTVKVVAEILASTGLSQLSELQRSHIYRRVSQAEVKRYDEIYPVTPIGDLLNADPHNRYRLEVSESSSDSFLPKDKLAQ